MRTKARLLENQIFFIHKSSRKHLKLITEESGSYIDINSNIEHVARLPEKGLPHNEISLEYIAEYYFNLNLIADPYIPMIRVGETFRKLPKLEIKRLINESKLSTKIKFIDILRCGIYHDDVELFNKVKKVFYSSSNSNLKVFKVLDRIFDTSILDVDTPKVTIKALGGLDLCLRVLHRLPYNNSKLVKNLDKPEYIKPLTKILNSTYLYTVDQLPLESDLYKLLYKPEYIKYLGDKCNFQGLTILLSLVANKEDEILIKAQLDRLMMRNNMIHRIPKSSHYFSVNYLVKNLNDFSKSIIAKEYLEHLAGKNNEDVKVVRLLKKLDKSLLTEQFKKLLDR